MRRNTTIGFDAKCANATDGARGRYARFVIGALAAEAPRRSYFRMYLPSREPNADYDALAARHNVESMEPDGSLWRLLGWPWRLWRVSSDAQRGRVELYHGLNELLPLGLQRRNIRSVVTIHSLSFLHYAEYGYVERLWHRLRLMPALHYSDRIVAVSECVKRDLVQHMGVDPDKVDVIYRGCSDEFMNNISDPDIATVRERYCLPQRYMLMVGTPNQRRNLDRIVESMAKLPADLALVVVGRRTQYYERVMLRARSLGLEERITLVSGVSDAELPAIYSGASMFVLLSQYEGFAPQIIEALTMGIPVIAARGSSLEEAGGPDSIYVDADDREQLVASVDMLLSDDALRRRMADSGRSYASRFRREVMAYNLMNCYERIGVDIKE